MDHRVKCFFLLRFHFFIFAYTKTNDSECPSNYQYSSKFCCVLKQFGYCQFTHILGCLFSIGAIIRFWQRQWNNTGEYRNSRHGLLVSILKGSTTVCIFYRKTCTGSYINIYTVMHGTYGTMSYVFILKWGRPKSGFARHHSKWHRELIPIKQWIYEKCCINSLTIESYDCEYNSNSGNLTHILTNNGIYSFSRVAIRLMPRDLIHDYSTLF